MEMKYFELIKSGTNHDFVRYRGIAVTISVILNALVLFGAIVWPKLNYGVDFAGGTELQIHFKRPVDVGELRDEVSKLGFGEPTVQRYGSESENQFLVRVERIALLTKEKADAIQADVQQSLTGLSAFRFDPEVGDKLDFTFKQPVDESALKGAVEKAGAQVKEVRLLTAREGADREYTVITQGPGDKIGSALRAKYGQDQVEIVRTEYVGPQVGKQLRVDGILSVLYAMAMILVYVGFRFDFRFSPGVVIALIHDAIITLGFFVVSRHEFNLTSVTVILTVVGYSVNDTIVVYDRIRENAKRHKGKPLRDLVNLSINEMLGRTILTSGATALSLVGLLFYGVGTIWDFAAAMVVGIISGTYSTWYIASPMTIWLEEHMAQRKALEEAKPKPKKPDAQAAAVR
ncbi:MAG: protein translocase subunit SecF [Deltaproteobacteria bacterium]|nr:MAG: protein translocase subunit SecF [Deltaproteobacteria bacterium]